MSFIEDLKTVFKNKDNGLMKIIVINIAVFIVVNLISNLPKGLRVTDAFVKNWLALPSNLSELLSHFWTLITYMFLHLDLMHILFNMLWLYWIGKIFTEYLGGQKLVSTYLFGGLAGGVLFIIASNLFPYLDSTSPLLGASAGVMAVVVGTATLVPEYVIHLLFFGTVRLKYVALISFLLTTVLDFSINTGGKVAHLGGALFGYLYIKQLQTKNNLSFNFSNFLERLINIFKTKSKLKKVHKRAKSDYEFNAEKSAKQKEVDKILEKIATSGYESLSKEEKTTLFSASKK